MSEVKKCCDNCDKRNKCTIYKHASQYSIIVNHDSSTDLEAMNTLSCVLYCDDFKPIKQTKKMYAHLVETCFGKKLEWYDYKMTSNAKEVKTNYEIIRVPLEDKEVEICE